MNPLNSFYLVHVMLLVSTALGKPRPVESEHQFSNLPEALAFAHARKDHPSMAFVGIYHGRNRIWSMTVPTEGRIA